MIQEIIPEVDKMLIEEELTEDKFVKKTNYNNNHIYIINAHDSPNSMREIGRLRELSFREAGGGTGKSIDIDKFDTDEHPFSQLIVWDPVSSDIVGGYRFMQGKNLISAERGNINSPTAEIFNFSKEFIEDYIPHSIELGRSWVQPKYQPSLDFRKGIYSLDNLWDGLGALMMNYSDVKYFFGKITMYKSFNVKARDLILGFMQIYFPDDKGLITPLPNLKVDLKTDLDSIREQFLCNDYKNDFKTLVRIVRELGEQVPPLITAYMNVSSTMRTFGTAVNPFFGGVEETGILVCIPDVYPEKTERHLKL